MSVDWTYVAYVITNIMCAAIILSYLFGWFRGKTVVLQDKYIILFIIATWQYQAVALYTRHALVIGVERAWMFNTVWWTSRTWFLTVVMVVIAAHVFNTRVLDRNGNAAS